MTKMTKNVDFLVFDEIFKFFVIFGLQGFLVNFTLRWVSIELVG